MGLKMTGIDGIISSKTKSGSNWKVAVWFIHTSQWLMTDLTGSLHWIELDSAQQGIKVGSLKFFLHSCLHSTASMSKRSGNESGSDAEFSRSDQETLGPSECKYNENVCVCVWEGERENYQQRRKTEFKKNFKFLRKRLGRQHLSVSTRNQRERERWENM